jgi:hypothetical protein
MIPKVVVDREHLHAGGITVENASGICAPWPRVKNEARNTKHAKARPKDESRQKERNRSQAQPTPMNALTKHQENSRANQAAPNKGQKQ